MPNTHSNSDPKSDSIPTPTVNRKKKPGALQGDVWLTVQTERAQKFIYGRRKSKDRPAIWGLIAFADTLKPIWLAASLDDPYADWWLVKTDAAIEACKHVIESSHQTLTVLLSQYCALQVETAHSTQPRRIPLRFSSPYGFRGAHLLAEYDRLMCLWLTVTHVGMPIDKVLEESLKTCSKKLRALFTVPQGFQDLGLNRRLVQADDPLHIKAKTLMGELPEDILNRVIVPSLQPRKDLDRKSQKSVENPLEILIAADPVVNEAKPDPSQDISPPAKTTTGGEGIKPIEP